MSIATIEAALVERLQQKVGDMVDRIYTAAEVAQLEEQLQMTPSVTVIYNGYRPSGDIAGGVVQAIAFSFLVVVAVKSAYVSGRSLGLKHDASPIVDACIEALLTFRPMDGTSVMKLRDAPGADFTETGFAYYPLIFETVRTYRGK